MTYTPISDLAEKRARATDVEITPDSGVGHNKSFFGDLAELAERINSAYALACKNIDDATTKVTSAVALLLQARKQVKHSEWGALVENNCKFSIETARRYMRMCERRWAIAGESGLDILLMCTDSAYENEYPEKAEAEKLELDWDAPSGDKTVTVTDITPTEVGTTKPESVQVPTQTKRTKIGVKTPPAVKGLPSGTPQRKAHKNWAAEAVAATVDQRAPLALRSR